MSEGKRAIEAAKTDKRISGIYLEIRNFDAGWANLSALRRKIEEFKATGKWVYAYADHLDEAGYFLASSANEIFLQPNGEIEFNGLGVSEAFLKGLFEKIEIEPRVFRVGKFKAAIEPFILEKMSDENREQTRALIDDVWSAVRTATAASRKMDEKKVDDIAASLKAKSALEAQEQGLVSELIYEDALELRMANFTVGPDEDIRLVSAGQLLRDGKARDILRGAGKKKIALVFAEGEIGSGVGGTDSQVVDLASLTT
ncbi:MAG: S49 family peptidase, partial [Bdellovibrionota bacterium]